MATESFDPPLTACPVCESSGLSEYFVDHRDISIHRCRDCGFQFMNPQYTDAYLNDYYANYTVHLEQDESLERAFLYGHGFYLSLLERYALPGSLLDVGCGNGTLMNAAQQRGWKVEGYDVDSDSNARVTARLGAKVLSGSFAALQLPTYDAVTMHQVLEHLKDPNPYLAKIYAALRAGGMILVAVPNVRSLSSSLKRFFERAGLKKHKVGSYYDSDHHVSYFSPQTLRSLLQKHGFDVVYQRNCHAVRRGQSRLKRALMRHVTDHLYPKSTFLVIGRKT